VQKNIQKINSMNKEEEKEEESKEEEN